MKKKSKPPFKHTNASQSGRLVEWFTDQKGNHLIRLNIPEGNPLEYKTNFNGDANRKYETWAAL